ncbi:hypothetical protein G9409_03045 [Chlorobium sp. BLA1]|uniref:hypothetical protein n=1 Tax=Candidatus Chlorobium masyuteum TaxID=2716876 RepID=UPI00141F9636|nr:hypothetical protein [Candidatus Chlorobium masyuteum]NHQ59572.1 hypothetical protein [Candidatus Chlorobium masyuteum]
MNKRAEELQAKAEKVVADLKEIHAESIELESSLSAEQDLLDIVRGIKEELGLQKVPTWPIQGPGSASCGWCTAGSGR